jgi:hypothetical protein
MVLQRGGVGGFGRDVFEEFEHDGGVACGGEVDFLVVGNFADSAGSGKYGAWWEGEIGGTRVRLRKGIFWARNGPGVGEGRRERDGEGAAKEVDFLERHFLFLGEVCAVESKLVWCVLLGLCLQLHGVRAGLYVQD